MKFEINTKIFEKIPELVLGVLICKNINNKGINEGIINLIRERENEIRSNFNTETLSQNPKINAWREVYRSFGAKPKKYKSSVEALYRRILVGDEIRHINKIVDIYNYLSLKYMLPVGGEDLDKIKGNFQLTIAGNNESPVLLLGDNEEKLPKEGEVIYKDEISAICRRFNWREADRTKFTEETKNAIIVIEGIPPVNSEEIEKIIKEMKELISKHCGGEINLFILNKDDKEIKF